MAEVVGMVASAIFSKVAGSLMEKVMGGNASDQEAQQRRLLAEQKAQQLRQQQAADKREADLNGKLAQSTAAAQARRRGRNSLSFTGPSAGLTSQLGG